MSETEFFEEIDAFFGGVFGDTPDPQAQATAAGRRGPRKGTPSARTSGLCAQKGRALARREAAMVALKAVVKEPRPWRATPGPYRAPRRQTKNHTTKTKRKKTLRGPGAHL